MTHIYSLGYKRTLFIINRATCGIGGAEVNVIDETCKPPRVLKGAACFFRNPIYARENSLSLSLSPSLLLIDVM